MLKDCLPYKSKIMTDINNNEGNHSPEESNEIVKTYPEATSFDELEVCPEILRGIYRGFEYPQPEIS